MEEEKRPRGNSASASQEEDLVTRLMIKEMVRLGGLGPAALEKKGLPVRDLRGVAGVAN